MRIRTAIAAAALASAAVLGSAGSAFADFNDNNVAANNDNNDIRVDPRINDFTDAILSHHSSNDGNWTGNFSGDVTIGEMEFDD